MDNAEAKKDKLKINNASLKFLLSSGFLSNEELKITIFIRPMTLFDKALIEDILIVEKDKLIRAIQQENQELETKLTALKLTETGMLYKISGL